MGVLRSGGGATEWIWKGSEGVAGTLEVVVSAPERAWRGLKHTFSIAAYSTGSRLIGEVFESTADPAKYVYRFEPQLDKDTANLVIQPHDKLSILAQLRDPRFHLELLILSEAYENISIFREPPFGRNSAVRKPQRTDIRNDRLREDFANLHMVLSRMLKHPAVKRQLVEGLKDLYEGVSDVVVSAEGGTVPLFFTEGNYSIPATRLSDGTLRYLCLLTILCDPDPPPLICIEEPELGLHPDVLPKLAKLLIEASSRTQLIVTTHSDVLVDLMTELPEAVVVCGKQDGKTTMRRLDRSALSEWLNEYRLGEMWSRGMIGGNRW